MAENTTTSESAEARKRPGGLGKRIIMTGAAIAVGLCLLFLMFKVYKKDQYEYIDLPIVLSNEEAVVDTLREGFTTHHQQITITFTAKGEYSDQLFTLADSLIDKAMEPTDDPKQGDYIRFQYGGYQLRYSNPKNADGSYAYTLKILPTYFTTIGREEAVDRAVQTFLEEASFTPLTSDYEKIKAVHDYIVANCEYDWRNSNLKHRHIKSTAYGALINGEASCQGYSVAMYRLLMEAGVRCRIITGNATSPETGETEYHAWNLVCLDGVWYNVDVSWDDETGSDAYFLKSDASFADHVRDAKYEDAAFQKAYPVSQSDWEA